MVLPDSWECKTDQSGRDYYVDHFNKKTQWNPPAEATLELCSKDQKSYEVKTFEWEGEEFTERLKNI